MENPQGIQAFDSSRIKFIGCPGYYNGRRDTMALQTWLATYERFARLARLPQEEYVEFSGTYLKDEALRWFNRLGSDITMNMDWSRFKDLIQQRFADTTHIDTVLDKWDRVKQYTTVSKYIQDFEDLRALVPDQYKTPLQDMRKFIKGLKYQTQKDVEAKEPRSLEDAQIKSNKFDQIYIKGSRKRTHFNPITVGNNTPLNMSSNNNNGVTPMELDTVQEKRNVNQKNKNYRKEIICYKCGNPGHIAPHCLKESRH